MTKIVYNACYGGFGLSHEGMMRYAEIKGITLYPEKKKFGLITYWTVPAEERPAPLEGDAWCLAEMDERAAYKRQYRELTLNDDRITRHDPALAQVVEELGDKANGDYAKLSIVDVPSGTLYRIDEYDGSESVETKDTYDWTVAP
jgi:hypothetical protein